jgi:hypothetical protein
MEPVAAVGETQLEIDAIMDAQAVCPLVREWACECWVTGNQPAAILTSRANLTGLRNS